MANKKIIWNAVAIFMGALAIVCIFWGKQILASSAGASFRSALNVVDLLICLLFLFVSGVLVRIAFTRQDKTDNKKFEIKMTLVSLAIAIYTAGKSWFILLPSYIFLLPLHNKLKSSFV